MSKRAFRSTPPLAAAAYPDHQTFDSGRRSFLVRLGAAALGAVSLAGLLPGCGDRPLPGEEDDTSRPPGGAPMPDARADQPRLVNSDGGVAPAPDARLDAGPPRPHFDATGGVAPMPDARSDPESDGS